MKYDWTAFAREVNNYLDNLDPFERPMRYTAWAEVLGIGWKTLKRKADKRPDSEWALALLRHKAKDAAWRGRFLKAAARRLGVSGHVPELAHMFGLTVKQVDALVRDARELGQLPPSKRATLKETP